MALIFFTTLLGTLTHMDPKIMTYGVFSGDTTTQSPQNLGFAHQMSPVLVSPDSTMDLGIDTFSGGALTDGNIYVLPLLEKMCLLPVSKFGFDIID